VTVRRGFLFHTETAIPASLIASAGERLTLNVDAEGVKKLDGGGRERLCPRCGRCPLSRRAADGAPIEEEAQAWSHLTPQALAQRSYASTLDTARVRCAIYAEGVGGGWI